MRLVAAMKARTVETAGRHSKYLAAATVMIHFQTEMTVDALRFGQQLTGQEARKHHPGQNPSGRGPSSPNSNEQHAAPLISPPGLWLQKGRVPKPDALAA